MVLYGIATGESVLRSKDFSDDVCVTNRGRGSEAILELTR